MNLRWMLGATVFSLFLGALSQAAIITSPTGLNPGELYRLAFVTSGSRTAISTDIGVYNTFVQASADAVPELASLGVDWKAVASTQNFHAMDNTGTNPTVSSGLPIYLLNDTLLVDDNLDLWDGSLDVGFDITESGGSLGGALVWTGTSPDGHGQVVRFLGGVGPRTGFSTSVSSVWVTFNGLPSTSEFGLYAISSPLTVADASDPGDFDGDGDVDGADFLRWQRGEVSDPPSASDLADWESNFGTGASPLGTSATVPEPATFVALLVGTMALFCRRPQGLCPSRKL